MEDIIVRYVSLPPSVKACTVADENNDYNIYINSCLSKRERKRAISHELTHIHSGHFLSSVPLWRAEREAEGKISGFSLLRQAESFKEEKAVPDMPVSGRLVRKEPAVKTAAPDYLHRMRDAAGVKAERIEKILNLSHADYTRYEFGKKPCPEYLRKAIVILIKKYAK